MPKEEKILAIHCSVFLSFFLTWVIIWNQGFWITRQDITFWLLHKVKFDTMLAWWFISNHNFDELLKSFWQLMNSKFLASLLFWTQVLKYLHIQVYYILLHKFLIAQSPLLLLSPLYYNINLNRNNSFTKNKRFSGTPQTQCIAF